MSDTEQDSGPVRVTFPLHPDRHAELERFAKAAGHEPSDAATVLVCMMLARLGPGAFVQLSDEEEAKLASFPVEEHRPALRQLMINEKRSKADPEVQELNGAMLRAGSRAAELLVELHQVLEDQEAAFDRLQEIEYARSPEDWWHDRHVANDFLDRFIDSDAAKPAPGESAPRWTAEGALTYLQQRLGAVAMRLHWLIH